MTEIHHRFGIPMTESQYAEEWSLNADALYSAGHYTWMCHQLGLATRVIEVGCGSGASTEALMGLERQVLTMESNPYCAARAMARLRSKGILAETISIDQLASLSSWSTPGVKLLVMDVLTPEITELLPARWFDAVTCWLVGSNPEHIGAALGKPIGQFDGSEMPSFRLKVQQRCYELGSRVVRTTGVVHVVDRVAIRSWEDKDQMRQYVADALNPIAGSHYSLSKGDCLLRKLSEGLGHSGIQYLASPPPGGQGVLVLTSARAMLAK